MSIDVVEEIIYILHRKMKVVLTKLIWHLSIRIEARFINILPLNGHGGEP